mmetsp:Transcript_47301/g.122320  ORF Transcript_47301/g.122320 Transcript_47301/m.122320 type:complete len:261 (-) Transcript_47301:1962-2744(-)
MKSSTELSKLFRFVWMKLEEGVTSGTSPFHLPFFLSNRFQASSETSLSPSGRTVVLRAADMSSRRLSFNTDLRSPKVGEILRDPNSSYLCYSREDKLQIRLIVKSRVLWLKDGGSTVTQHVGPLEGQMGVPMFTPWENDYVEMRWKAAPARCQRTYLAPCPPSASLTSQKVIEMVGNVGAESDYRVSAFSMPLKEKNIIPSFEKRDPTPTEGHQGRRNFGVVLSYVESMDVVHLQYTGHIRAMFVWEQDGGVWKGQWVAA